MVIIEEQTYEEKVKMYNKCTKKELIDMLINVNLILDGQELRYQMTEMQQDDWDNDDLWNGFEKKYK